MDKIQFSLNVILLYSIEPRERRYIKRYGFLSFAKNMGNNATRVAKN